MVALIGAWFDRRFLCCCFFRKLSPAHRIHIQWIGFPPGTRQLPRDFVGAQPIELIELRSRAQLMAIPVALHLDQSESPSLIPEAALRSTDRGTSIPPAATADHKLKVRDCRPPSWAWIVGARELAG